MVDKGENAVLSCENNAKPLPTITWSKNGENIPVVSWFVYFYNIF